MGQQKRILVVADISNLYYCVKRRYGNGRKLNYTKLLEVVRQAGQIVRATAYGVELQQQASKFKAALEHKGFDTKFKRPKIFNHVNDKQDRKADWDVGMTVDIVKAIEENTCDIIVLGTADGDLSACAEYICSKGKECWVIGCGISYELKNVASRWDEIPESMLEDAKVVA